LITIAELALGNRGHSHFWRRACDVSKRKSPGPVHSKAQQGFLFATHKAFAKKWARQAGETGPKGNPASKAAYRALPARKEARKKA
jgi:hypothetical protein